MAAMENRNRMLASSIILSFLLLACSMEPAEALTGKQKYALAVSRIRAKRGYNTFLNYVASSGAQASVESFLNVKGNTLLLFIPSDYSLLRLSAANKAKLRNKAKLQAFVKFHFTTSLLSYYTLTNFFRVTGTLTSLQGGTIIKFGVVNKHPVFGPSFARLPSQKATILQGDVCLTQDVSAQGINNAFFPAGW